MPSTPDQLASRILEQIIDLPDKRKLVALAGPPATGKSTVAEALCKKLSINININKSFKTFYDRAIRKLSINVNINKLVRTLFEGLIKKLSTNINKYLNQFFNGINEYFKFIVSNILNFFKILTRAVVEGLNDIYEFRVKEKTIRNFLSKGVYASLVIALVFSGFYVKDIITDMDSVKISLEIKSDK